MFRAKLEFASVGFVEGGKPEYLEKNPLSKDENQQQAKAIAALLCRD